MENKEDPKSSSTEADELFDEMLQSLEQRTNWDGRPLIKYSGFWCPLRVFRPILSIQKHFKANDSDIILTSFPKSGTTWLMSLTFSILNRHLYSIAQSPLLTSHPQQIVPFLEFNLYFNQENPNLQHLSSPRIFTTHMPFNVLPDSIHKSACKIIYICRNPLDQFISHRHFLLENKIVKEAVPLELDEAFDMFCEGVHPFGPFCDQVLGYWKAHLEYPEKVMFLRYEDLKEDIVFCLKKIAEFLGCPFSLEEEKQGGVEEISKLCSFDNLKNLEVNKNGHIGVAAKKSSYFRKGEVGDWRNYLTPAMAQRFQKLMESKLQGYDSLLEKLQNGSF